MENIARWFRREVQWMLALPLIAGLGVLPTSGQAQIPAAGADCEQGIGIAKGCESPKRVGEEVDCEFTVSFNPVESCFDTQQLDNVTDTLDWDNNDVFGFAVPPDEFVADVEVIEVEGNASCTSAGGGCPSVVGGGCALDSVTCSVANGDFAKGDCVVPCKVGPATSTFSDLPGAPENGVVHFEAVSEPISADQDFLNLNVCPPVLGTNCGSVEDEAAVQRQALCDNPNREPGSPPCSPANPPSGRNTATNFTPILVEPFVTIETSCTDVEPDSPESTVTVTVTNNGTAAATGCAATATLDGMNVVLSDGVDPSNFDLDPNGSESFTGTVTINQCPGALLDVEAQVECDDVCLPDVNTPECQISDSAENMCMCEADGDGPNDYKCYATKYQPERGATRPELPSDLFLQDQFAEDESDGSRVKVLRLNEICTPVDKAGEGIQNPEAHLTCYKVRELSARKPRVGVRDTDQFGTEELWVANTREICLPAVKNGEGNLAAVEESQAHLQCYLGRTQRGSDPPVTGIRELTDQFESQEYDVGRTSLHCNPLFQKGDEQLVVPQWGGFPFPIEGDASSDVHYKCYDIQDADGDDRWRGVPGTEPATMIQDQFHPNGAAIVVGRPIRLCEPAIKQLLAD